MSDLLYYVRMCTQQNQSREHSVERVIRRTTNTWMSKEKQLVINKEQCSVLGAREGLSSYR